MVLKLDLDLEINDDYNFSSKLHSDKYYNLVYYENQDPGWIIEFSNTFE